jgi:hypothetical protein
MNRVASVALISLIAAPAMSCHHAAQLAELSQERIGEVDFGASLQSMEAAPKESVSKQVSHPECLMVAIQAYPGTLFMVEQGRITRANAAPESPNLLGVEVGDSRSAVFEGYPQL